MIKARGDDGAARLEESRHSCPRRVSRGYFRLRRPQACCRMRFKD